MFISPEFTMTDSKNLKMNEDKGNYSYLWSACQRILQMKIFNKLYSLWN